MREGEHKGGECELMYSTLLLIIFNDRSRPSLKSCLEAAVTYSDPTCSGLISYDQAMSIELSDLNRGSGSAMPDGADINFRTV
jgi:hypothetical protein